VFDEVTYFLKQKLKNYNKNTIKLLFKRAGITPEVEFFFWKVGILF
jgi:hypothetical protein